MAPTMLLAKNSTVGTMVHNV